MNIDDEFILLFKSNFRGRGDVVARYCQSGEKSWYSPILRNDGQQDICHKPCKNCSNKDYAPWDDDLLISHLEGDDILGVYPLLRDNTCRFLVWDFDNHDGRRNPLQDVVGFYRVCLRAGVRIYILRSKSGKGYHAYLFFKQPVPAWKARLVAMALIEETQASLDCGICFSFDKVFTAQDRLTSTSPLGNLISLPFQGKAMEAGHTMLLDPETEFQDPYVDQAAVLGSLLKLSEDDLDRLIRERQLIRQAGASREEKKVKKPEVVKTSGKIVKGARNTTLASVAGVLRRQGAGYEEILSALLAFNSKKCDPPLQELEVDRIARSITSYPAGPGNGDQEITLPQALAQVVDLPKKIKCDPGVVFEEPTLLALQIIQDKSPVEWARIRKVLKENAVPLRDLNRAMGRMRQRTNGPIACPYAVRDGKFVHIRQGQGGEMIQPLCNFTARIVSENVHDDGMEQEAVFAIEGALANGETLAPIEVPAGTFSSLSWVMNNWGSRPVLLAGSTIKDHVRAAMQMLSCEASRQTVYSHLGWRHVKGEWVYLHGGGGIGKDGLIRDLSVSLGQAKLKDFLIPAPPEGSELVAAMRASLKILEVAPKRLTVPLLASTYLAVLGEILPIDFSEFLAGLTGSQKSEISALVQAHFGNFHSRNLPCTWYGTANALEKLAFLAKDAVLVVDDFIPTGTTNEVSGMHSKADRLLRGQGNRSGRARMKADGSLNREFFPRGLIVASGEDIPKGHSLRGRMLILEISPGEVDLQVLTHLQQCARDGLLAQAMAGYLQWLAPKIDDFKKKLPEQLQKVRKDARKALQGVHDRTPDIIASLYLGLVSFLEFALEVEAITEGEFEDLGKMVWQALTEAGRLQAQHQTSEDVVNMFLRLLVSALSSGQAHLADAKTNGEPPEAAYWGWSPKGNQVPESYSPQGDCIGWVGDLELYIEPGSAFAAAQKIARSQGTSLPVTAQTLWKRLKERGLLTKVEEGHNTHRLQVAGKRQHALWLTKESLGWFGNAVPSEPSQVSDNKVLPLRQKTK